MSQSTPPTLILIDGHSLAFRSYYAFAKGRDGGLRTAAGVSTSVCFGFLKALEELTKLERPEAIAIAFDLDLPTFRHEADRTYKADRKETPEDFIADLKNLRELLEAMNLPIVTAPGYEADDVLATLSQRASAEGYQVKIMSGDRDLFQLVDAAKRISVLYLNKNFLQRSNSAGPVVIGREEVIAALGITPEQVVDYKALCGDKSDNIPGVLGIGEKTAVKLLQEYGTLAQVYQSLDAIKGNLKTRLAEGQESAWHSQRMAQLILDVPLEIQIADCHLKGCDRSLVEPVLEKLEFRTYLKKLPQLLATFGGTLESEAETAIPEATPVNLDDSDEDLWFYSAADTAAAQGEKPSIIRPQIIDTPAKLTALVNILQQQTDPATPVAWDTETSSLEVLDAELVGIGCSWGIQPTDVAYIPISHQQGQNLDLNLVLTALRPILESADYPKTFQNAKYDRLVFRGQGIKLAGVVFDPMLASYVLNPDNTHNLTDLALRYLGLAIQSYESVVPKGQKIAEIDIPLIAEYCGKQVYATWQLVGKMRTEFQELPKLYLLLEEVEQPLEPVLAEMEYTGIRIDPDYLHKFSQELETDLKAIEIRAYAAAGETFNLGSPKQLSQILFDKLNLDTKKSRKIKTGYSTDHATLEKMQDDHPVIEAILEYRTLDKLKSTYVDALPKLVHPKTQRVHTDFNQTVTSTGRLSSSNPNLQNIPIRTAFSRQIRRAFLPESGWMLVSADYSQIELRILAHLTREPILVEAYQQNQDVHGVTARLLFEKEEITAEERRLGKIINFGVIYGMGAHRFAREAGVKATEGKKFIEKFNERYPKVFEYLERMKREAIARGYVETILGRRRYFNFEGNSLRHPHSNNPDEIDLKKLKPSNNDAQLLRAAANAPIQGSSADIIKIATIRLQEILNQHQARLLLQVHDELVLEVPPAEMEELQVKIKSVMESAVKLSVPLVVDVRAGQNWMEAK
jgi:DNA polymerase-1